MILYFKTYFPVGFMIVLFGLYPLLYNFVVLFNRFSYKIELYKMQKEV